MQKHANKEGDINTQTESILTVEITFSHRPTLRYLAEDY